jgi:hypothetical protein
MGLFFILVLAAKGDFLVDMAKTIFVSMFSVAGLGGLGAAAFWLPRWRKEQERQMEAIAARAVERAGAQPASTSPIWSPSRVTDLEWPADTDPAEKESSRVRRKSRS